MGRGAPFCPALVVAALAACGGGDLEVRNPERPLPPYSGHPAELFDDAIEPAAVGYPAEPGTNPASDNRLRERTQTGDAVVRAQVSTLTAQTQEGGRSWQVGLHTLDRLAGSGPLEKDFVLRVAAGDPAAGLVAGQEGKLVGTRVVAFVREFAHPGAPTGDLRFHLAPDSAEEAKAVQAAVLLGEVR